MQDSKSSLFGIAFKKRYKNKTHWTDYFSYLYLFLGIFLMFGPVVWLGLSSVKTQAGIQEYPPTILPLAQKEIQIEGYEKPLLLYNVTLEDGSVKELAEIKRVGITSKMLDPKNPGLDLKLGVKINGV